MKFLLTLNGQEHLLEISQGNTLSCRFDGTAFEAEAVEVAPGIYSLLIGGKSCHVRIAPSPEWAGEITSPDSSQYVAQTDGASYTIAVRDPRRWNRSRTVMAREGRQQITAPMPGKIVRVLIAEGQQVEAGQGLIVVEAMKMQNEIKCHAAGTVEKLLVREGQAVTAGESLLIIE
jgi:biotin carboxyl carrier protein